MVTWIVVLAGLLLWIGVAAWRASIFIGNDMVETWGTEGGEYDPTTYGELIRAGIRHGLCWPFALIGFLFMTGCRVIARLLWMWAYHYARNIHEATNPEPAPTPSPAYVPNEKLLVTDELAKVTDDEDPIAPPTRLQARLAEQAELARLEYAASHLNDVTSVGSIPVYEPRRAAPDE